MKSNYDKKIKLRCTVCGSDVDFEDIAGVLTCSKCGKEYPGGKKELERLNMPRINKEIEKIQEEIFTDMKQDLKKAFSGSKYLKIK